MDHYDKAVEFLSDGERWAHGNDPQPRFLAALTHATLALVDRLETLTYLMYGEDE